MRNTVIGLVLVSVFLFARVATAANPGDLDSTFGDGGVVFENTVLDSDSSGGTGDLFKKLLIQADGKIVAVGVWQYSRNILVRYNPNGRRDDTFGDQGKVFTDVISYSDSTEMATLQTDGKIIVTGASDGRRFRAARYNTNGNLDVDFTNNAAAAYFTNSPREFYGHAVAVQPDGKVVVAGNCGDICVGRLTSEGLADPGFGGGDGIVTIPYTTFGGDFAHVNDLVLQPDGKIVVGGYTFRPISEGMSDVDVFLARFDSGGSLDNTFGEGGKVVLGTGAADLGRDVILQPDGKIVIAGSCYDNDGRGSFCMFRVNSNGSLDCDWRLLFFCGIELVTFDLHDEGKAIGLQPDGKLVFAGECALPSRETNVCIARIRSDGTMDSGFGFGGRVSRQLRSTGGIHGVMSLARQLDGKILLGGGISLAPQGGPGVSFIARFHDGISIPPLGTIIGGCTSVDRRCCKMEHGICTLCVPRSSPCP